MADITGGDYHAAIAKRGHVSVHEPCVGSGAMIIALARSMLDQGINYQQAMHVTAIDVSATAAHMAFVQFSLLHIPAVVYVGNSLSNEMRDCFYTPAHIMGGWQTKLARTHEEGVTHDLPRVPEGPQESVPAAASNVQEQSAGVKQFSLF